MKKIFKKVLSSFVIISLVSNFLVFQNEVKADANPWTQAKAEYLARRALIGVDQNTVNSLYNAGSASAAVNLLFPDANGPDRTAYNAQVSALTSTPGFSFTGASSMYQLYQAKYALDPYEAKRKLFAVFEDIFSSNAYGGVINFNDINNTQDLIYGETLGNYKNLVKKIFYNAGSPGDFTEGQFLDLFNQTNKRYPNENYARELLQLFLMEEYKPLDNKDLGSIRNYEETDVASFAKMIFGFTYDTGSTSHIVSYQVPTYTGSDIRSVAFLTGALKSGDNFSFYNSASGTIDLAALQAGGGTSLRDNAINYIFSKREDAISQALANKLFRFYVNENPTAQELNSLSSIITQNNFEILPSVKWLLSSDMMYSDTAMNELRYKNPLELAIGTIKLLNQNNKTYNDPMIYNTSLLSNLGWEPLTQNSIFGRDGFDKNDNFFNANLQNKWITYLPKLAYSYGTKTSTAYNLLPYTSTQVLTYNTFAEINPASLVGATMIGTGAVTYTFSGATTKTYNFYSAQFDLANQVLKTDGGNISFDLTTMNATDNTKVMFSSGTFSTGGISYPITAASFSPKTAGSLDRSLTPDEVISVFEQKLLVGRTIDSDTRSSLVSFLNTDEKGNTILFDSTKQKEKIESLATIIMTLPEYILNSGITKQSDNNTDTSFLNSTNSKIIFVDLPGGYDYLNNFISKKNFTDMQTLRPTINRKANELVDAGDFYMENHLAYGAGGTNGLKELYDNGELRVFNRTGTKDHSRDHDQASKAVQSCDSFTQTNVDGSFGKFIKNEVPSNTMVIGNSKPYALRGGKYINIGAGGNILNNERLSTDKKTQMLNTLRTIGNSKTYPGNTAGTFKDAVTIDAIGTTAKANTPRDGAGYGNSQNYDFIKTMVNNGYGKAFYMFGDGGYDTHSGEAGSLDANINKVVTSMVSFFDAVKANQDITIVLFSEFGRTIKENGSAGTDHGKGGVMWVLTSNPSLKAALPQKIYGDLDVTKEKEDLLNVGIYYDSVYSKIVEALYSKTGIYTHKLEDDISTSAPKIANFNASLKPNGSNYQTNISFDVESPNFSISSASNVKVKYGKDFSNLTNTINNWEIQYQSNPVVKGNKVNFTKQVSNTSAFTGTFAYEIRVSNNQYAETVLTGIVDTAPYKTGALAISDTKDTVLNTFSNKLVSGDETLANKILLGQTTGTGMTEKVLTKGNGVRLILGTGATYIDRLSGSGTWNGRFVLGDILDKNIIFSSGATTNSGEKLRDLTVDKLIKIGADTIGVGLKLDRNINVEVSGLKTSTNYRVVSSEDLQNWTYMTGITSDSTGKANFSTNHFTYFALIDTTPVVVPVIPPVVVNPPVSSGGGGGGGGGGLSRDYCPAGDYSSSYYDKICGVKPSSSTGTISNISTGIINTIIPVSNTIVNTGYEKKYIKYNGLQILDIKNYSSSQVFRKQAFEVAKSKTISITNKAEYIKKLNALLEAKFALDTDKTMDTLSLKNRYIKQKILLDSFYKRKIK
ncbi:MAG: DUF1800 family protein [Candidatus Gracilibacteria bacterium]|nr:DUF1800 family protein [Candidatus Gracilibacteria bacterium]